MAKPKSRRAGEEKLRKEEVKKLRKGEEKPRMDATRKVKPIVPEGYNGPAFQAEDGRTLYIGRWLTRNQWGTLFLTGDGLDRFKSPEMPVVEDKRVAVDNLLIYASQKKLVRVQ